MSRYHKVVLALICLVLFGSIAARAWTSSGESGNPSAPASSLTGGQGFLPGLPGGESGSATSEEGEQGRLQETLPAVTEGSLFALIGFALGYTTKKLVKIGLILLAVGFVTIQALVHLGAVEVDWSALTEKLNQWVMNVREGNTVQELLTDRIPAAGGLVTGYLLGFRKG